MLLTLLQSLVAPPPIAQSSGGKRLKTKLRRLEELEWVTDFVFDDIEAKRKKRKRDEILLMMQ